jgi:hypothetical protein
MMHSRFIGGPLLVLAMAVGACSDLAATSGSHVGATDTVVTQREAGDLAFQYHQQALELSKMARRLELEAQWYEERGEQDERVQDMRNKAQQLFIAAQEADQRAQEYRRQVPHGRVY